MVTDPLKFVQQIESLKVDHVFENGTNIQALKNNSPGIARKLLTRGLKDLIEFVDANKTINTTEQLIFTVEALMRDFPALTIEEFFIVFRDIKKGVYGKWYERLKLSEIEDCLRKYESETRADFIEKRSKGLKEELNEVDYIEFQKNYASDIQAKKAKKQAEEQYRIDRREILNARKNG